MKIYHGCHLPSFFAIFICMGQCSCSLIITKVCFYSSEDLNEDEVEALSAADFNTDADAEVVKSRKSFLYNYFSSMLLLERSFHIVSYFLY